MKKCRPQPLQVSHQTYSIFPFPNPFRVNVFEVPWHIFGGHRWGAPRTPSTTFPECWGVATTSSPAGKWRKGWWRWWRKLRLCSFWPFLYCQICGWLFGCKEAMVVTVFEAGVMMCQELLKLCAGQLGETLASALCLAWGWLSTFDTTAKGQGLQESVQKLLQNAADFFAWQLEPRHFAFVRQGVKNAEKSIWWAAELIFLPSWPGRFHPSEMAALFLVFLPPNFAWNDWGRSFVQGKLWASRVLRCSLRPCFLLQVHQRFPVRVLPFWPCPAQSQAEQTATGVLRFTGWGYSVVFPASSPAREVRKSHRWSAGCDASLACGRPEPGEMSWGAKPFTQN